MKWSARLGRFAGIDVYVHASFLLLLAWVAWSYWSATGTLADWLIAIERTPNVRGAPALRTAAEAELRKRLVYEGTRLDLVDDARAPWWMRYNPVRCAPRSAPSV